MTDLNLQSLLARVEAATGPDPAIDGALDVLTDHDGEAWPPRYTDSVDACLALAERVLPNLRVRLSQADDDWLAQFETLNVQNVSWSRGPTPALALCAAILKAKIADIASQEIKGVGR